DGSEPTTLELGVGARSFQATHHFLDDAGPGSSTAYTITVTVADDDDLSSSQGTSVTVNNVAPMGNAITGPRSGVRGQSLDFAASFDDAGTLDTHSAVWNWGDGTTTIGQISESGGTGTTSASHVFTASGVYTVTLTVTDNDGGATVVSKQLEMVVAQLQPDTADPTKTALVVGGTTDGDVILLTRVSQTSILVTIDGVSQGVFAPTDRILVYGQAGDDVVLLDGSIRNDAWIHGGAGGDLLLGGAGNNIPLGGTGGDILLGTSGPHLLGGGLGSPPPHARPRADTP